MLQLCTVLSFGAIQKTQTQIQKHRIFVSWLVFVCAFIVDLLLDAFSDTHMAIS